MSTVLNFNSLDELVAQQTSIVARYKLYNGEVVNFAHFLTPASMTCNHFYRGEKCLTI